MVATNLTISFSVRGEEDVRIIKEYLDQCKKNGQQQSKVIVSAIKQYINSTTKWIEQEHREIHMKKVDELYNSDMNGDSAELMRYLQLSECIHLNMDCYICRDMYQRIRNVSRDERGEYVAYMMQEYDKGVENLV